MEKTINGQVITAIAFGFDGCHKFYLAENLSDIMNLCEYGYELHFIDELPFAWLDSCPLRFIHSADLSVSYVPQFTPAYFEWWNVNEDIQRELDELAREQEEANE